MAVSTARKAGYGAKCLELCSDDCETISNELKGLLASTEAGTRTRLHGFPAVKIPGARSYVAGNRPGCDPLATRRRFPF